MHIQAPQNANTRVQQYPDAHVRKDFQGKK